MKKPGQRCGLLACCVPDPIGKETLMTRAVLFDHYGDVDVLQVADVEQPAPGPGQVLVRVRAAGVNPGEATIREGVLHELWPASFPSGQGSDLAGVVEELGDGVEGFGVGNEVIGFTHERASHAELVLVDAENLTLRPPNVSWQAAGSLFVVGTTAWAAVRAVDLQPGELVVVSGAAGGVGTIAVQLAVLAGARVIGLASESHHRWLRDHGAIPVAHGEGVAARIRLAADGRLDAFIDTFGDGYVELALELGVAPERIDTIADRDAAERYPVKTDGNIAGASAKVLAELAQLVADGLLEVPIADVYPLERVQDAFRELERRHTLGKIVLMPGVGGAQ
jgi:NADPH:quinone reductase-like Zn-dependent oxidoreductase